MNQQRGKILRDTNAGPGLVSIAGQQYTFTLEGMWRSDDPPVVGKAVEVTLSEDNQVMSLRPVPEAELAKEQARRVANAAGENGKLIAQAMVARFGVPMLAALAALVVGWFFLNTLSVGGALGPRMGVSFWGLLGVVNSPLGGLQAVSMRSGAGLYGLLALIALAAPLAPYFWTDKRAHLGGVLPLAFMLFVAVMAYSGLTSSIDETRQAASIFGGERSAQMAATMAAELRSQIFKAVSIGLGGYVSMLAALYLAWRGVSRFRAAQTQARAAAVPA